MLYSNIKRVDTQRMSAEIIALKYRIFGYQVAIKNLQRSLKSVEKTKAKQKETYKSTILQKVTDDNPRHN